MAESENDGERGWLGWVQIAAVAGVVLIALAITLMLARGQEAEQGEVRPDRAVPVDIVRPETAAHQIEIAATGSVRAKAFVSITPQVGGQVVEVSDAVREGGRFEPGEILFRIDPRDYQVAVQRAEAALADAQSALAQLEAEAEIARQEWRDTYPGREITPLAAREPQLEAARSRVMSAEADLRQARINLDRTTLSYPFAGRVTQSRIEEGQVLVAGQPYGELYSIGELEIVAPVPPADAARLDGPEGRPARVVYEGSDTERPARVIREGAAFDTRSRLITLFLEPEDADTLRPGQFADILIEGPRVARTFALPESALAGLDNVHVVRGGAIEDMRVEIIDRAEGRVHVAPFDYGEGVIVSPIPEGTLGRQARIVNADGNGS